jgi:N-methylhydantoinase B
MLIRKKELRQDSGGYGRHRGGLGQEVVFEVTSETPVGMIFMAERCKFAAPGANGGGDGAPGEITIDGRAFDHRRNVVLTKGRVVRLATPGGGGFGEAAERSERSAAADGALGYTRTR